MSLTLIVLLRIIHILAGVFWAGAAFMVAAFLEPNARALGPDASKFMQRLVGQMHMTTIIILAAFLNVLAGVWLYWIFSGGFQVKWITSAHGLSLTIGALAAIVTFILGLGVTRPTLVRMGALGQEMQSAGGPPKPEQMAQMQSLQTRLATAGRAGAVLLVIAVIGMAVARYI
jgi:uncharacterized membrane protein